MIRRYYIMDDWPPNLIVAIVLLGLAGVYVTLFYGATAKGYSPLTAGLLASLGTLVYVAVVLYALRDWWEG